MEWLSKVVVTISIYRLSITAKIIDKLLNFKLINFLFEDVIVLSDLLAMRANDLSYEMKFNFMNKGFLC